MYLEERQVVQEILLQFRDYLECNLFYIWGSQEPDRSENSVEEERFKELITDFLDDNMYNAVVEDIIRKL